MTNDDAVSLRDFFEAELKAHQALDNERFSTIDRALGNLMRLVWIVLLGVAGSVGTAVVNLVVHH